MNFLELLNAVAQVAKPAHKDDINIQSMVEKLADADVDSLDTLMLVMYLSIIYGIPDEASKDFHPVTAEELLDFIKKHKTKEPASIDQALEEIK
jgi:acyl carrier protein